MSDNMTAATDARTAPVAVWQVLEKLSKEELIEWRVKPIANKLSVQERNLDIGFPFGWYPVLLSTELAVSEVKPLRYFARELAIWRGEDGKPRMLDAFCRHLGAHMGHGGKVYGNLLECPFHAWRYSGEEGSVKEIPYSKSIPPRVTRKCTRNYPMREMNGLIWMWYHPEDIEPLYEPVKLPECSDPEWSDYDICEWNIYGSLQNMAENGVDTAHFRYIHGTADVPEAELHWGEYDRSGIVRAKMGTPKGVVDGMITSKSQGPGQNWVRFTGICETLLIACITPVDEDHIHARYLYTQPKAQVEGKMARVAKAIIADVNKQLDQDKVVWDRQQYQPKPVICNGDGPIAQFRIFYSKYYADGDGKPRHLQAAT
ncbi:MAG: aromatic ring-hydroxylating dioxygenase subunit alpha [Hellea sp.]|nr:aromatic ring-hydroxylating dioxygenase subunit alpha [Hellea sp.]